MWPGHDKKYIRYHDEEWGVPIREDRLLFECLCLEGQQAGLSWITVLRKRDRYRECFFNFEIKKCAQLTDDYIDTLLLDQGLIRSRPKLLSVRQNARITLEIQSEFGSFHNYIWGFSSESATAIAYKDQSEIPAATTTSAQMAADLKKRGFKFVGSKICYAYMQAVGIVNDHTTSCFRFKEILREMANE
ncbi:MAG: DNA-3-methyladenine glycosylase I [Gammaproteobacteria bacterium]|nr:DNA-3-methyladenine glycosylase I [Gammaproteobacteria bacterium]